MNNDLATINVQAGTTDMDVSASGGWSESYVKHLYTTLIGRFWQNTGLVFAIAASPATATTDVWFLERRRRDSSPVTWVSEPVVGRPISRSEALRIARQILERAERERMELAEREAKRGVRWEDEA